MSNHDPYSDSPSLLVGFGTTKVYSADRSRHCHGINNAQTPVNERYREWVLKNSVFLKTAKILPPCTRAAASCRPASFWFPSLRATSNN